MKPSGVDAHAKNVNRPRNRLIDPVVSVLASRWSKNDVSMLVEYPKTLCCGVSILVSFHVNIDHQEIGRVDPDVGVRVG
jgi:hypothetical protein